MSSRAALLVLLAALASCDPVDVNEGDFVFAATVRASVATGGGQSDGDSTAPALSGDGRYVVFVSAARNLVPPVDTLGFLNVYRHDLLTGITELVSIGDGGAVADGDSLGPSISGDGSLVAFHSAATNLLPVADTLANEDIFLRDLVNGTTVRVSVNTTGGEPDLPSLNPVLSDDGQFVAFESDATDLIVGDTNGLTDVYRRALPAGPVVRVSVSETGAEVSAGFVGGSQPSISADGSVVAFVSDCADMVAGKGTLFNDIFVRDFNAVAPFLTERVSIGTVPGPDPVGDSDSPSISADGRFVAFSSDAMNIVTPDTNLNADIFVYDRQNPGTVRVSVNTAGAQANQNSEEPVISGDGRSVVFRSSAGNLVTGDSNGAADVFLRDLARGTTTLLSISTLGGQTSPLDSVADLAISRDGRYAAFWSSSDLLVNGDTNGLNDIFVRGPLR